MTTTPEEILIAGNGTLYVATELPPASLPAYLSDTLNAAFVDVGFTSDDGAKFTDAKTTSSVRPWQSFYPVRVHITERQATLELTLQQWNELTMITAFGGGGVIEPQPGEYRYIPPAPEELAVVSLVLDLADGTRNFRVTIGRAFVTSNTETTFARSGPALLPVTFEVLAPSTGAEPWTIDSDDPAWAPVAS